MPRSEHIVSSEYSYHIGCRGNNKERYPLPLDTVWKVMCDYIWLTNMKYDLIVKSFVLMPNHFHMEVITPNANLSECMQYFMCNTSKEINKLSNRINHIHGSRYFRCLIDNSFYAKHVYKYIYQNPVKAGLCKLVEEYKYSTLAMYLGLTPITIPLHKDLEIIRNTDWTLDWLNSPIDEHNWSELKSALRRPSLAFSVNRITKRKSDLILKLL